MSDPDIRIKYEGGDADNNVIDMRLLGLSLQGADKIISDGLILLVHKRVPKKRERAVVVSKVREPLKGSFELWAAWQAAKGLLPLGVPTAIHLAEHFIAEWWTALIAKYSGKPAIEEKAIQAMVDLSREHLLAKDRSEERAHELNMTLMGAIRETLATQGRMIEQFASPIGPSVDWAEIIPRGSTKSILTTEDATMIRASQKLEWSKAEELRLNTDGFKFHTHGLSVENPERDGYLMAHVYDREFEKENNVYTEASQRKSAIIVLARKGYRGNQLVAIDILDFVREES